MRVWLVKFDEPLPVDPNPRLYRMGMLAEALVAKGHQLVWWTSTYDHQSGRLRFPKDTTEEIRSGYRLRLLHTVKGYSRAVSGTRALNNLRQAFRFRAAADSEPRPDVIYCAMPTPELAWVSAGVGSRIGVPVVLDARDMWPDVIAELLPPAKRLVSWPYLALMRAMLRSAARRSIGCTSITDPFLDWILGYAGRPRGAQDAVFPLAFMESQIAASELAVAEKVLPLGVSGEFNVLFLGRLNRTVFDAFEPVIEAARLLRDRRRPFRFVFAGQGDCADQLRQRAAGFPEILFVGHVGTPAMEALKRRSHVALLCVSRRKDYQISLSNKIFEYLAAGLPVASHLTGLVGKLLLSERCGFTYDDGQSLAEGLIRLAEDEESRRAMGTQSRRLFAERFSANAVYSGLADYLEAQALHRH